MKNILKNRQPVILPCVLFYWRRNRWHPSLVMKGLKPYMELFALAKCRFFTFVGDSVQARAVGSAEDDPNQLTSSSQEFAVSSSRHDDALSVALCRTSSTQH